MMIARLLALSGLLAVALAMTPEEACGGAFNFFPDGSRVPGNGAWGSARFFAEGPCLGVSGIGMTETHLKTLLVIDRTDFLNSYMELPGSGGQLAWAQEVNLNTPAHAQRGLNVLTNTFCSSGAHVQDGKFFSVGGDMQAGALSNYIDAKGGFSMRLFEPCADGTCDFKIDGKLQEDRWYPASQLLGDGRILVVGGANAGVAINGAGNNVPSLEYYPNPKAAPAIDLPFLTDTLPYNLYPFVHLLPNAEVFIFAGDSYILWNTETNAVVPGDKPAIGAVDDAGTAITHSYPLAGTSAMFTLSPRTGYQPEIMICGGSATTTYAGVGNANDNGAATNGCWYINPLAAKPAWTRTDMKLPRVMPMVVLLPDGHVMVHGGTQTGHSGIPNGAHNASLVPEIFDSKTKTWYPGVTGVSKIPRGYHASSVLLHDARVFISGSNPHQDGIQVMGDDYPTEFRTEFYLPPYFRLGVPPPALINAPADIAIGSTFWVAFKAPPGAKTVSIVLSQPGFSTHGNNQGMRQVELLVKQLRTNGNVYAAFVAGPPSLNVCPPTWYWMFVVVDGMPNVEGHHVFVK